MRRRRGLVGTTTIYEGPNAQSLSLRHALHISLQWPYSSACLQLSGSAGNSLYTCASVRDLHAGLRQLANQQLPSEDINPPFGRGVVITNYLTHGWLWRGAVGSARRRVDISGVTSGGGVWR